MCALENIVNTPPVSPSLIFVTIKSDSCIAHFKAGTKPRIVIVSELPPLVNGKLVFKTRYTQ